MTPCACGNPLGDRNKTGLCRSCRMKNLRTDPAYEARRAAAFRKALATNPELKARHIERSRASLASWRNTPEGLAKIQANARKATVASNMPEARLRRAAACRQTRTGWCPDDRRDDYLKMRRHVGAAEAKRMILADIVAAERKRLAGMTQHERNMERLRNGATLITKPDLRKASSAFTLAGVVGEIA